MHDFIIIIVDLPLFCRNIMHSCISLSPPPPKVVVLLHNDKLQRSNNHEVSSTFGALSKLLLSYFTSSNFFL